jgi:hypothetical protein
MASLYSQPPGLGNALPSVARTFERANGTQLSSRDRHATVLGVLDWPDANGENVRDGIFIGSFAASTLIPCFALAQDSTEEAKVGDGAISAGFEAGFTVMW